MNLALGWCSLSMLWCSKIRLLLIRRPVEGEVQAKFHEALTRARRWGVLVKIELFDKRPVKSCDFPWKRNFVSYDGYVHPCCYTTQTGDRASQNQRSFGNLINSSFEEIWKSDDIFVISQQDESWNFARGLRALPEILRQTGPAARHWRRTASRLKA